MVVITKAQTVALQATVAPVMPLVVAGVVPVQMLEMANQVVQVHNATASAVQPVNGNQAGVAQVVVQGATAKGMAMPAQ